MFWHTTIFHLPNVKIRCFLKRQLPHFNILQALNVTVWSCIQIQWGLLNWIFSKAWGGQILTLCSSVSYCPLNHLIFLHPRLEICCCCFESFQHGLPSKPQDQTHCNGSCVINQFTQETASCLTESPIQLSLGRKQSCWGRRGELSRGFANRRSRMEISGPWHVSCLFLDAICSPTTPFLLSMCVCACVCVCVCVCLTQATAVAWHCHEGSQGTTNDAVWPAEGGLLEGAGVLVQEGVHAMGGGGAAVPHEGFWNAQNDDCHHLWSPENKQWL